MIDDRVDQLRKDFDDSFTRAAVSTSHEERSLLLLRVGRERLAVPSDNVRALFAARRIVAVPTSWEAFLGVTTLRGVVLPAYGLGALRGAPETGPLAWMIDVGGVALAFSAFERLARVARHVVTDAVVIEGAAWPLLDVGAVIETVRTRVALEPREHD